MKARNKSAKKITVEGKDLKEVQHFRYLGSYISTNSNIEKKISTTLEHSEVNNFS